MTEDSRSEHATLSVESFFKEWGSIATESCEPSYDEWRHERAVRQYRLLTVDVNLGVLLDTVELHHIACDYNARGQGRGTHVLSLLCRLADKHGVEILLNAASGERGEAQRRLVDWYIRHGFIALDKKKTPLMIRKTITAGDLPSVRSLGRRKKAGVQ